MKNTRTFAALAVIAVATGAAPALAQSPRPREDLTVPPGPSQPPVSRSEDRIVGKVLAIDRDAGLMKLATEDEIIVVEVPPPAVRAFRVGDTVSVPRSATEPPSAFPRE